MATEGEGRGSGETSPAAGGEARGAPPRIRLSTDQLKSSYVNFANANSTREEVVLNFGMNSAWDRSQPEAVVELSHRIVMNPHAAKRLAQVLANLVADYEARFGELK